MKLYVKCQRNGGDSYVAYEGQDNDTVIRLLNELGATNIQFITLEAYEAGLPQPGR